MEIMRAIIELILVAIVVVIVVKVLLRRRKGDEINSIENYRDALGTLSDMRGKENRSYLRVLSPEEQRSARQPGVDDASSTIRIQPSAVLRPPVPPVHVARPNEAIVFEDSEQVQAASHLSQAQHHDEPEWAIDRMFAGQRLQHRRMIAVGAALGLVILLVVIGVVIGQKPTHSHPLVSTTTTTAAKTHATTTTTTLDTLSAVAQTASGATYSLPGVTTVTATLTVTTQCWTIATQGPENKQIYAAVIMPNQPVSLQATRSMSISVAAPGNVAIVVNGLRVIMPQHLTIPTVLTFTATAPLSTTTTSTSTTTTQVP
jgi:hypothetical protein